MSSMLYQNTYKNTYSVNVHLNPRSYMEYELLKQQQKLAKM